MSGTHAWFLRGPGSAPVLITLLDAVLLLASAAAVVTLLGGAGRFDMAGTRVTIRAAARPDLRDGAFGTLRAVLGGGTRFRPP